MGRQAAVDERHQRIRARRRRRPARRPASVEVAELAGETPRTGAVVNPVECCADLRIGPWPSSRRNGRVSARRSARCGRAVGRPRAPASVRATVASARDEADPGDDRDRAPRRPRRPPSAIGGGRRPPAEAGEDERRERSGHRADGNLYQRHEDRYMAPRDRCRARTGQQPPRARGALPSSGTADEPAHDHLDTARARGRVPQDARDPRSGTRPRPTAQLDAAALAAGRDPRAGRRSRARPGALAERDRSALRGVDYRLRADGSMRSIGHRLGRRHRRPAAGGPGAGGRARQAPALRQPALSVALRRPLAHAEPDLVRGGRVREPDARGPSSTRPSRRRDAAARAVSRRGRPSGPPGFVMSWSADVLEHDLARLQDVAALGDARAPSARSARRAARSCPPR